MTMASMTMASMTMANSAHPNRVLVGRTLPAEGPRPITVSLDGGLGSLGLTPLWGSPALGGSQRDHPGQGLT